MRSGRADRGGRDRGQATVEFALVLPLLVLCVAGLVWVANVFTVQIRLEHAAREGARAAAVEPERAAAVSAVAVARGMGDAARVVTSVDAEFVTVEVSATVDGVPFVGLGERVLTAEAHMRREDIID